MKATWRLTNTAVSELIAAVMAATVGSTKLLPEGPWKGEGLRGEALGRS